MQEKDVKVHLRPLFAKVIQSLRQEGFRATSRKVFVHLRRGRVPNEFDLKHGTDTGGMEHLWKFQISSPNRRFGEGYQPTEEQELLDAINFLCEDLRPFTFIDLGCGKGRPLLIAARLGFHYVIGVEFACELAEIARTNLAKMGITNAVVECADAADFQFPNGDIVVYLYNPFSQEVMRKVAANLCECPAKKLYVIYKVAACAEVFDFSGFLSQYGFPPARPYIKIWKKPTAETAKDLGMKQLIPSCVQVDNF